MEGRGSANPECWGPPLPPLGARLGAQASDVGGALDLARVPPDLAAPLVEHGGLACVLLSRADRVPHLRMLGDQAEHDPLAPAGDEDRHRARRTRPQLLDAAPDARQRFLEQPHAIARLTKLIPVLAVVVVEPTSAESEHQPSP